MKLVKKLFFIFLVFLFCIAGCEKNTDTAKKINEKKFVQIYCDVVTYADLVNKNFRQEFVDSVLQSYDINKEDFDFTVKYYTSKDGKWEKIFEKIVVELDKRAELYKSEKDSSALNPELEKLESERTNE